jgi:hypothetical protein
VRPPLSGRILVVVVTAVVLAACSTVDQPRRSDTPSLRCANDPGRGRSLDATRPLFFIFCAQSP